MIPSRPKIYHFTHVNSLPDVIASEWLFSDGYMIRNGHSTTTVGMSSIKKRRLEQCRVACHESLMVGDCVPFYFCPRSVMLYVLYRDNNPDLTYHGGQEPLIHFEADLYDSTSWAYENNVAWAFTDFNASAAYASFHNDVSHLDEIDWDAIAAHNWQSVQEQKQAEFLVHERFPWHLIERIGVYGQEQARQVTNMLEATQLRPVVELRRDWYY